MKVSSYIDYEHNSVHANSCQVKVVNSRIPHTTGNQEVLHCCQWWVLVFRHKVFFSDSAEKTTMSIFAFLSFIRINLKITCVANWLCFVKIQRKMLIQKVTKLLRFRKIANFQLSEAGLTSKWGRISPEVYRWHQKQSMYVLRPCSIVVIIQCVWLVS